MCPRFGNLVAFLSSFDLAQVYEYYISHHLAEAFEYLFGSVTCLPGCFSMYRTRTANKGRPLILSNRIIEEYSECNVDTYTRRACSPSARVDTLRHSHSVARPLECPAVATSSLDQQQDP